MKIYGNLKCEYEKFTQMEIILKQNYFIFQWHQKIELTDRDNYKIQYVLFQHEINVNPNIFQSKLYLFKFWRKPLVIKYKCLYVACAESAPLSIYDRNKPFGKVYIQDQFSYKKKLSYLLVTHEILIIKFLRSYKVERKCYYKTNIFQRDFLMPPSP